MSMRTAYVAGTVVSLVLHVALGWVWSVLGAVLAGSLTNRLGALVGATSMVLAWGLAILYSFMTAPGETVEMARVVAALLGNLPSPVTVALTLFIAAALGLTGGWFGSTLRTLVYHGQRTDT
jgi:hypothetical protein